MSYISKKPTKEKERLYRYLESKKVGSRNYGKVINVSTLNKYAQKKNYHFKVNGTLFVLMNKNRRILMKGMFTKNKKQIKMWYVI